MASYRCKSCFGTFSGATALQDIKEHIFACVVAENDDIDVEGLERDLKEKYPEIEEIEMQFGDWDSPDYAVAKLKDGSSHKLVHKWKDDSLREEKKEEKEERFERLCKDFEDKRAFVLEITEKMRAIAPNSEARYSNDGHGYRFKAKTRKGWDTFSLFKTHESEIEKFFATFRAQYAEKLKGTLKKINSDYYVGDVYLNEWLDANQGKEITVELKSAKPL